MKPFYLAEKKNEVIKAAVAWLKTPFVDHGRTRAGVDCVGLMIKIYQETGLIGPDLVVPDYSLDSGWFSDENPIEMVVQETGMFTRVWTREENTRERNLGQMFGIAPGDLILMRLGRVPFHTGICAGGPLFIHCHPTSGVVRSDLRDWTYFQRLQIIYRPIVP